MARAPIPSRRRSPEHWLVLAAAAFGVLVLVAAHVVLVPDPRGVGTHEQLGMEPCALLDRYGIPCPGCGVTTSVTLAAHGELAQSLATQPLGFLLALFAVLFLPWALAQHLRGRDLWGEVRRRLPFPKAVVALAFLIGAAWVYKLVRMS